MNFLTKLIWVIAFTFSLASELRASPRTETLKILSFNFNSEATLADSDSSLRDARYGAIVDYLRKKSPDVILIQEGWNYRRDPSVAVTLSRELGYDLSYRVGMGAPFLFYDSNAILAKKELRMTEERDVKLPHSAGQIGDGKNGIFVLGRISYAVGAKLTLKTGQPIYIYSTHLIAQTDAEKRDQLATIDHEVRVQAKEDGFDPEHVEVVIAGDFNSSYGTRAIDYLQDRGYEDVIESIHPEFRGCSFCGSPLDPHFNPMTIAPHLTPSQTVFENERDDWIFTRGPRLRILSANFVFNTPIPPGVWMSDHLGIASTLAFDSEPPSAGESPLYESSVEPGPATILNIDDQMLLSGKIGHGESNEIEVKSLRGLVISNLSSHKFTIQIQGPAPVLLGGKGITLYKGGNTALIFNRSGSYFIKIQGRHVSIRLKAMVQF